MNSRFTLDGSEALEQQLDLLCQEITREIRALIPAYKLEALILGGGYGRGEGGVLKTEQGEQPYNDLEFYVFLKGNTLLNDRKYRAQLHHLGERFTERVGIEVEFKIISIQKLRQSQVSMFYYDLVAAHRLLHGEEGVLANCDHHRSAHRIPLAEATRLLMNRCSGLLFSKGLLERETFTGEDADFVARNIAKAKLAMGDVILTAYGHYHFSCRERHRRLEKLAIAQETSWIAPFVEPHREGVEFKLHPFKSSASREELAKSHTDASQFAKELWLWLENRRLGKRFSKVEEYSFCQTPKCPESEPLKNLALTARTFGVLSSISSGAARYPRERLLNTLPLLLWLDAPLSRPETRARIEGQLRTHGGDLQSAISAYKAIWNRYN
jgi:hypothetical protein